MWKVKWLIASRTEFDVMFRYDVSESATFYIGIVQKWYLNLLWCILYSCLPGFQIKHRLITRPKYVHQNITNFSPKTVVLFAWDQDLGSFTYVLLVLQSGSRKNLHPPSENCDRGCWCRSLSEKDYSLRWGPWPMQGKIRHSQSFHLSNFANCAQRWLP